MPNVSIQMQNIDYGDRNIFISMGFMSFILLLYFFRVFLALLAKLIYKITN